MTGLQPASTSEGEEAETIGVRERGRDPENTSPLLGNAGDFTDEARAALTLAVEQYGNELIARARRRTRNEIVVKGDIDAAVSELQPQSVRDRVKFVADWLKLTGFMFIGFAVAQFNAVRGQGDEIDQGSVSWLVFDIILATALTTGGFLTDRASLRSSPPTSA